ncbi:hypothetical protein RFI_35110 [Reticulomyxa filosa]|uniref:Uncharacterized protein n=1 Tax=Reticulomyxa filosa TaxID=46433 RepID=X6LLU0_RETFI|nr:hypothetical protein RFI_35110 [Reticulomyxa filosa]|eukprot:ETO02326.1 hypothetical protein RFI_35110 [Reticulomyxa filosa]
MKEHDLKLLTKDNALLNELYEEEKIKYEAELLTLEKLKQEMVEKEVEFELHTHVNKRYLVELRKSPEEMVENEEDKRKELKEQLDKCIK